MAEFSANLTKSLGVNERAAVTVIDQRSLTRGLLGSQFSGCEFQAERDLAFA